MVEASDGNGQSGSGSVEGEKRLHVARIGAFVLVPPPDDGERETFPAFFNRLLEELRSDPRVLTVEDHGGLKGDFLWPLQLYPDGPGISQEDILTGRDGFVGTQFAPPLYFSIQVPIKNQPMWQEDTAAPTDKYFVAWDGSCLVIGWEQTDLEIAVPGGQVVESLLRDACKRAGGRLHVQACAFLCQHRFLHVDVRGRPTTKDDERGLYGAGSLPDEIVVGTPPGLALEVFVKYVRADVGTAMRYWTAARNLTERILETERAARSEVAHLLSHYRFHAEAAAGLAGSRWRDRIRPWRREARALIVRVWLALTNVELLLGRRTREWDHLVDEAKDEAIEEVVLREITSDTRRLTKLDLSSLERAVEHAASRLDTRAMAAASGWGAVGGAVAGVVVTLLAS